MQGNRGRDTRPERALRSELHRRGLRFRIHRRPVAELRCTADVVFPTERVAVFVDGCFWHGCSDHGHTTHRNSAYWAEKIARNKSRDSRNNGLLAAMGWKVVRVWEHDRPIESAARINAVVEARRVRQ